jgi:hypothetical protein
MSSDAAPIAAPLAEQPAQPAGDAATTSAPAAAPVAFVKRARNRGNLRKKEEAAAAGGGSEGEEDVTRIERKAKVARGEPLTFATKPPGQQQAPGEDSVHVAYQTNRAVPTGRDDSVFKVLETETETDRDARWVCAVVHVLLRRACLHIIMAADYSCCINLFAAQGAA